MYGMNNMMNPYQNSCGPNYNQNSFGSYMSQPQTLTRVTGLDGAKAYQMGANSTVALFDNNEDLMYVKSTDGAGFPTIRTFKFEEVVGNLEKQNTCNYVSREEMEEYVQQFIQQQSRQTRTSKSISTSEGDSEKRSRGSIQSDV